jgi:hypothetical protein
MQPEHILQGEKGGRWKLTALGSAAASPLKGTSGDELESIRTRLKRTTTSAYRSPEVRDIKRSGIVDVQADIWVRTWKIRRTLQLTCSA